MSYRNHLPQLDTLFITDGGLETTLIFQDGIDLPHFAAFGLLDSQAGIDRLRGYFERYIGIARAQDVGIVLETPTWRASADWGGLLGYDEAALAAINRRAVALLVDIRKELETPATRMIISGILGPRGDGYRAQGRMSVNEARAYHTPQIATFAQTDADMLTAYTLNYVDEAIGIVHAAKEAAMPVVISFTLETDGRLPSREALADAIERTDAATGAYPVYYMINCAHPTHFEATLHAGGAWRARIRGLRANASKRSHVELDASTELDAGDPHELGEHYRALRPLLPQLTVVGGCCGTDHRHVAAICSACV